MVTSRNSTALRLSLSGLALAAVALLTLWVSSPTRAAARLAETLTFPLSPAVVAADTRVIQSASRLASTYGFSHSIFCSSNRCRIYVSQGYVLALQPRESVVVGVEATLRPEFLDLDAQWLTAWRLRWRTERLRWSLTVHDATSPPAGRETSGSFEQLGLIPEVENKELLQTVLLALQQQLGERLAEQLE